MFGIFHSLFLSCPVLLPSDQHDQHQSRPRRGVIFPSLRLARLGKGRPSELVVGRFWFATNRWQLHSTLTQDADQRQWEHVTPNWYIS